MLECKVCRSEVFQIKHENLNMLVPAQYPLRGTLALDCCNTCGFVSNATGNLDTDYSRYYTQLNKHSSRASQDLMKEDGRYFDALVDYIVSKTGMRVEGSSILDWGAGANIFGEICLRHGAQEVLNYDIGMPSLGERKFDLVISTHCFEHLVNPLEDLRYLSNFVKDNGILAISTPDISGYQNCYYGPYNHFDLEHINHFSPKSMTRLFSEVGLDVVAIRQGERRVAESLSYSDLLVVARKSRNTYKEMLEIEDFNPKSMLTSFLNYNKSDFEKCKSDIRDFLMSVRQSSDAITVLYGLSSYAFRVLAFAERENLIKHIDYFADSDARLSSMEMIPGKKILSRSEFETLVDKTSLVASQTKRVNVLIASVNSSRIVDMFKSEPKFQHCVLKVIGPSTKNR